MKLETDPVSGVVFSTVEEQEKIPQVRLDRELWLTTDRSRVVEASNPEAAFRYGMKGTLVPRPEAERLGALPLAEVKTRARKQKQTDEQETSSGNDGSSR